MRTAGHWAALGGNRGPERDTHLNHRNKPLTLRFSGSTVFKPIKKQGRDNREQLVTFRKLKSRMLFATKKQNVHFKTKPERKPSSEAGQSWKTAKGPHQEPAQPGVTQFAFGKQNRTVTHVCVIVGSVTRGL